MANTTESLIETILSEADHNDEADVDDKISCKCERCHTGQLMKTFLNKFGLNVIPKNKNISVQSLEILNQFETVVRDRRTIQNTNGKFHSGKQVRKIRRERQKQMEEEAIERKRKKEEGENTIDDFFNFDDIPQKPSSLTRREYRSVND